MKKIAKQSSANRRALFINTASKAGVNIAIIEKDFWVCWMLDYLFNHCKWMKCLSFKGGTSLSKAYHLIERFSEDIDLILDWRVLGYSMNEPWEKRSNTKQDHFNKDVNAKTVAFLREKFIPIIQADVIDELGMDVRIKLDSEEDQTILFTYPQEFSDQLFSQDIRLEIGSLAIWSPSSYKEIKPYAAEYYAHLFTNPTTSILTVLPVRTFWEKITILYHEANRPINSIIPFRYSRHYYDIFCLASSWVKQAAFSEIGLLKQVATFKEKFYPRKWANYMNAKPGSMKLMPPSHCLKTLEEDYERMQGMIFGYKPSFIDLMENINNLEYEINNLNKR